MLFAESLHPEVSGGDCPPLSLPLPWDHSSKPHALFPQDLLNSKWILPGWNPLTWTFLLLLLLSSKFFSAPPSPGSPWGPPHISLTPLLGSLAQTLDWYEHYTQRAPEESGFKHPAMFKHLTRPDSSWTNLNALEKSRDSALSQFPFWSRNASLSRRQNVCMARFIFLPADWH